MTGVLLKTSRFAISTCRSTKSLFSLGARALSASSSITWLMEKPQISNILPSVQLVLNRNIRTEVEKDLDEFLTKEIEVEKGATKPQTEQNLINFTVSTNGPEVTLTKQKDGEIIVVKFDINNSVGMESPLEMDAGKEESMPSTISKPPFTVEIKKVDNKVLTIQCSFPPPAEDYADDADAEVSQESGEQQDTMEDLFEIDEVAICEGEITDSTYSHHAAVMDGNLYELLMDMLDERGINSEFVEKMTEFSTNYEHNKYVGFLEQLQSFVNQK